MLDYGNLFCFSATDFQYFASSFWKQWKYELLTGQSDGSYCYMLMIYKEISK